MTSYVQTPSQAVRRTCKVTKLLGSPSGQKFKCQSLRWISTYQKIGRTCLFSLHDMICLLFSAHFKKKTFFFILANQKIAQGTLRFLHSIFALSVISPHAQSQNLLWLLVPVTKPCTGCWLLFNPSANARLVGSLDGLRGI